VYFVSLSLFLYHDTATTRIYTLSLHDALPISGHWRRTSGIGGGHCCAKEGFFSNRCRWREAADRQSVRRRAPARHACGASRTWRSEEHTSELQSRSDLVCRLLLEKKKKANDKH